jgi:hypothetical protein
MNRGHSGTVWNRQTVDHKRLVSHSKNEINRVMLLRKYQLQNKFTASGSLLERDRARKVSQASDSDISFWI